MKKTLLLLGSILALCLAQVATAAPITPITGGGTGTSTIPADGNLLMGQGGNYVFVSSSSLKGSGGGSGLVSSTPFANSGMLFNNNGSVSASSSFFVSTSTGNVSVQSLEFVKYADQFPGADMCVQISNAYNALPSNGGTVYVPSGFYTCTNRIVIGTAGKILQLVGAGGGGFFNGGGTGIQYLNSTGTLFTYNVANYSSAGIGMYNMSLFGPAGVGNPGSSTIPSTASTTATVAIHLGDSNGATGFTLQGVQISGFGQGVQVGANTFITNINLDAIQKNGVNVNYIRSSNADENNKITYSLIADSQSSLSSIANDCVYLDNNVSGDWQLTGNSFDDCQIAMGESGTGNTAVHINNNHFENPNSATSCYDFVTSNSGQSAFLSIYSSGNDYLTNGTGSGSNCGELVFNGGNFITSGDLLGGYSMAASSTIRFVTNQDNADTVSWFGLVNTSGAKNQYVYGNQSTTAMGFGSGSNSPVFSATGTTFQFPNLTVGKFLALDSNGNVVTTGTPSGGTGGVSSSSPIASGTLSQFQANGNITNSFLFQKNNAILLDSGVSSTFEVSSTNSGALGSYLILSNAADTAGDQNAIVSYDGKSGSPYRGAILFTGSSVGQDSMNFLSGNATSVSNLTSEFYIGSADGGTLVGVGTAQPSSTLHVVGTLKVTGNISASSSLQVNGSLIDNQGNKYSTSTASGGANGNLYVTPTSSVLANNVVAFLNAASSTVKATTSIYTFSNGDTSLNSSTDNGLLDIVNASGTHVLTVASTTNNANLFQVLSPTGTNPFLGVTSSGIPLFLGSSTAVTIGGTSLALDACTSTTSVVPFVLSTSTDIINTEAQTQPGNPSTVNYNSYISAVAAGSSTITTQVCGLVTAGVTPNATKYNFSIQRDSGM